MKKSKLALVSLLLIFPTLVGCGRKRRSGEVNLVIWEDASNIEVVRQLCDDFIAQYQEMYYDAPTITIDIIDQEEKSAIEKMSTIASTGNGPDIASVTHDTIANGVVEELIAPVTYPEGMAARMTDEAMEAVTVINEYDEEVVYGYPITAESTVVMYDDRLIDEDELATFESLKASTKKLGITLTGDNVGYYTWGLYSDSVLFGENGKEVTNVNIGTDQSVTNVTNFYNNYTSCFEDCEPETALNYVNMGRIAGFISSPYMINDAKNMFGDHLKIAKLPALGTVEMKPFSGYKAYVVSRYSPNAAIAHELCQFLTSVDANLTRLLEKDYLPAIPLDATPEIRRAINRSEFAKTFASSLQNSRPMPNIPEMSNFWKPMNNVGTRFKNNAGSLTEPGVKAELDSVTETLLRG